MSTIHPGAWVVNDSFQRVARVKDAHAGDEPSLDLVLYARNGDRIGRESPAMGGPRDFEPCCGAEFWREIIKPAFPLPRYGSLEDIVSLVGT